MARSSVGTRCKTPQASFRVICPFLEVIQESGLPYGVVV